MPWAPGLGPFTPVVGPHFLRVTSQYLRPFIGAVGAIVPLQVASRIQHARSWRGIGARRGLRN